MRDYSNARRAPKIWYEKLGPAGRRAGCYLCGTAMQMKRHKRHFGRNPAARSWQIFCPYKAIFKNAYQIRLGRFPVSSTHESWRVSLSEQLLELPSSVRGYLYRGCTLVVGCYL